MAITEKSGALKYKDTSGDVTIMWAETKIANVDGLQEALDGKAASSHTHSKSEIIDFPASMPASDVKDWAKADTKPAYTASEVGADESGAAAQALSDAKAYADSSIQLAIQNSWEASY